MVKCGPCTRVQWSYCLPAVSSISTIYIHWNIGKHCAFCAMIVNWNNPLSRQFKYWRNLSMQNPRLSCGYPQYRWAVAEKPPDLRSTLRRSISIKLLSLPTICTICIPWVSKPPIHYTAWKLCNSSYYSITAVTVLVGAYAESRPAKKPNWPP